MKCTCRFAKREGLTKRTGVVTCAKFSTNKFKAYAQGFFVHQFPQPAIYEIEIRR